MYSRRASPRGRRAGCRLFQALRQTQRPLADVGVGRGVYRPFDRARDDRPLGVVDSGMIDDAMAEQRPVLHQPKHGVSSGSCLLRWQRTTDDYTRAAPSLVASMAAAFIAWNAGLGYLRGMAVTGDSLRRGEPLALSRTPAARTGDVVRVVPVVARSARISPITGANLKPWPEHGEAATILGAPGRRSIRK